MLIEERESYEGLSLAQSLKSLVVLQQNELAMTEPILALQCIKYHFVIWTPGDRCSVNRRIESG